MKKILFCILITLCAPVASSELISVESILELVESENETEKFFAMGIAMGTAETLILLQDEQSDYCWPEDKPLAARTLIALVNQHYESHTNKHTKEIFNSHFPMAAYFTIREFFPC